MIYFDNAATSYPKSDAVIAAVSEHIVRSGGNPGRSGHRLASAAAEAVFDAREAVGGMMNITGPQNVIFTSGATAALNLALLGTARYGDHIICTNLEHNSVLRPLYFLRRNRSVGVSYVDALCPDDELIARITRAITRRTRMIVTLHASNVCPRVLPISRIGEVAHRHGLIYVVDAAQSAGVFPIDTLRDGADIVCIPSHKGIGGIQGAGVAAFADGFDFARLNGVTYGGNGVNTVYGEMGNTPPESYEAGTLPVPAIVSMTAGIADIGNMGLTAVAAHENMLRMRLCKGLNRLGARIYGEGLGRGGTIMFNADGIGGSDLADRLASVDICVRAGMHCAPLAHDALQTGGDAVRVSFSHANTADEVDEFISALSEILKKQ